ncbi:MAG TPA: hypothetical protein VF753_08365 [Terriglobales bacterium]
MTFAFDRLLHRIFPAIVLVLLSACALAEEPYRLEPVDLAPNALPSGLQDKISPKGLRLVTDSNGLRMEICEVFWTKEAAGQTRPAKSKLIYTDLAPGALVGVLHFLPSASEDYREDFRDQKLKAGYYTMRYAVAPDDDDQDALWLSPAAADRDGEAKVTLDDLKRRSKLASGTRQPAVLHLVPTEIGKKDFPGLRADNQGTCVLDLQFPVKVGSAPAHDMPLALIIVTPKESDAS